MSGQLRSGNMSWWSGLLRPDKSFYMFGFDDPETPILTQLSSLIEPFAKHGGVDMFIYIQVDPRSHLSTNASAWDGHLDTFEPSIGDTKMCEIYSKDPIFADETGNKVFCLTEFEKELSDPIIGNYSFWKTYSNEKYAPEMLLQQLYGKSYLFYYDIM